jgi:hypothetical protein
MARLDAATSSLFHAKAVLGYSARYQAAHDMMTTTGFCCARYLQQAALHNQCAGWMERLVRRSSTSEGGSETHQSLCRDMMGFASLNPSYAAHYPNNPFPGT